MRNISRIGATTVVTLVLILITFQVQRLRMLAATITKLDELAGVTTGY
jgi:hypothetical protein